MEHKDFDTEERPLGAYRQILRLLTDPALTDTELVNLRQYLSARRALLRRGRYELSQAEKRKLIEEQAQMESF